MVRIDSRAGVVSGEALPSVCSSWSRSVRDREVDGVVLWTTCGPSSGGAGKTRATRGSRTCRIRCCRRSSADHDPGGRGVAGPDRIGPTVVTSGFAFTGKFPAVDIPLGFGQVGRPPVLVIVSGYSRVITPDAAVAAECAPVRRALRADQPWRRGSEGVRVDNESAVDVAWWKPQLTEAMNAFRARCDQVIPVPPADPNRSVSSTPTLSGTSFLPTRLPHPTDFNTQLPTRCNRNSRQHRILSCQPVQRWQATARRCSNCRPWRRWSARGRAPSRRSR